MFGWRFLPRIQININPTRTIIKKSFDLTNSRCSISLTKYIINSNYQRNNYESLKHTRLFHSIRKKEFQKSLMNQSKPSIPSFPIGKKLVLPLIDVKEQLSSNIKGNDINISQITPNNGRFRIIPSTSSILGVSSTDTTISCTIFDENGNVSAVSKKFPKMKFLEMHGLFPRDLRTIDKSAVDISPAILVRNNCILINLLHIKAIVKSDMVMVFDTVDIAFKDINSPITSSPASKLSLFIYDLESKLKKQIIPSHGNWTQSYEHRALESILINVMSCLESELLIHVEYSQELLHELEDQFDRARLKDLLVKSKDLTLFYQKSLLIRDVLDDLLENDEDMEGMYLTRKKEHVLELLHYENQKHRPFTENNSTFSLDKVDEMSIRNGSKFNIEMDHEIDEIEMLLETYYKQCDEFVQQSGSLISDIKSTEEIMNIILDANRNSLMLYELKIAIYTLGIAMATFLAALYGMNLKIIIEDSNFGFGAVTVFSIFAAVLLVKGSFKKLGFVQKSTMTLSTPTPAALANGVKNRSTNSNINASKLMKQLHLNEKELEELPPYLYYYHRHYKEDQINRRKLSKRFTEFWSGFRKQSRNMTNIILFRKNDCDLKRRDLNWHWLINERKPKK